MSTTDDPFHDLLELEDEFYKEGYEAGVADSAYAGMIEGKVFGVEKGYDKALELARMHGRAMVWKLRTSNNQETAKGSSPQGDIESFNIRPITEMQDQLEGLSSKTRLQKHIDNLLSLTDATTVRPENSDEAVTEVDDRLAKARAKAKIIANIAGESLNPTATTSSGIEDATGLNARH